MKCKMHNQTLNSNLIVKVKLTLLVKVKLSKINSSNKTNKYKIWKVDWLMILKMLQSKILN